MRFICEQRDFEILSSLLAARCSEVGYDITVDQGRTLAATMLGNSGYSDYLLSLENPDREDLDFYLQESRNTNKSIFCEYLILGFSRIGVHFPEAQQVGLTIFERLDWLPEMQILPFQNR